MRLNLGDGEGEVSSPVGRRLDDLTWHDVSLERSGAQVTLTVDTRLTSRYSTDSSVDSDYGSFTVYFL